MTQPLTPTIIEALHKATDEMADARTFRGYAPDLGYDFLRNAIAENDYRKRGCDIAPDEIFVSTAQRVIPEIFRKYLPLTALLLSLTLCIRYM